MDILHLKEISPIVLGNNELARVKSAVDCHEIYHF